MKSRPLSFQIWVVIAGITTGIGLLLMLLLPAILGQFFTREIFATIENAQAIRFPARVFEMVPDQEELRRRGAADESEIQNSRTVAHLLVTGNGTAIVGQKLPQEATAKIRRNLLAQTAAVGYYSDTINGQTLYYVIRKQPFPKLNLSIVSFMWDTYRDELVRTLYKRIALILGAVLVLSWLPAIWLARYLSRPLVRLEGHVQAIANRQLDRPVVVDRQDEIGRLAASIERMRQQLRKQDEAQQSLLQHISHELKTPVMVIRSYAQSIQDGVFPKGDLASSVEVIENESERLEKRIRDLLYLTKLDYLSARQSVREPVRLAELTESVAERLRWRRPDLIWELDLEPAVIVADPEQWTVALENLFDNQMRYAATRISVRLRAEPVPVLVIGNDGPPLEPGLEAALFQAFRKGGKGEFGLGLAIVKRIADLHGADVRARNREGGVDFTIAFAKE